MRMEMAFTSPLLYNLLDQHVSGIEKGEGKVLDLLPPCLLLQGTPLISIDPQLPNKIVFACMMMRMRSPLLIKVLRGQYSLAKLCMSV